jgi:hypothetical protein
MIKKYHTIRPNRREFLIVTAAVRSAARLAAQALGNPERPWYRSTWVGMEIGPTGANDHDTLYMSAASGADWVESLLKAKAEYGVVFMKDQNFAYYNSKVARKCPNLGTRDLLRECLDAAASHGIPLIAYCQIQYDTAAWMAHPDWRMKDQEGKDIRPRLCYNSPYFDYNRQIAAEMLTYPVQGFHFDMLDFGFGTPVGCWCDRCKHLFASQYGMDMPSGVTWDDGWDKMLQFRCNSNTRFCQRLTAFVHEVQPGASVDFNYHGYPPFSWYPGEKPVQHAQNGDFVTAEGLPWVFGNYNPSLLSLFMAGARPNGPVQGVTSRSVFNYHDFTIRPTADMKWEVFTYLAHGAQCTIVDKANYDGSLDSVVYERIGDIFGEARRKREYFGHPPVQEVGLFYSARSRDWYGREDTEKYMAAFSGAHKALVQAHIPFGMLMDENLTIERLKQFPIVYLPNAVVVSSDHAALLSEYVEAGGNLIVTGLTALGDNYGRITSESTLGKLLGVRLIDSELQYPDNYIRLPGSLAGGTGRFLLRDIPPDWPMLTWAPIAIYQAAGAQAFGELMTATRSQDNSWSKHMSPGKVAGPAVFLNRHGKGKTILVAAMPDAAFIQRYRMPEHRCLIRNLVRYLNPTPELEVDAPHSVESVITRDRKSNRLFVHFLSFHAPPTATSAPFDKGRQVLPPTMEEPLEYVARLAMNRHYARASALGAKTRLETRGPEIIVSTDEIHEVVEIRTS